MLFGLPVTAAIHARVGFVDYLGRPQCLALGQRIQLVRGNGTKFGIQPAEKHLSALSESGRVIGLFQQCLKKKMAGLERRMRN